MRGKIITSEARAKELGPIVEKMVTQAKLGDLAARRLLRARLPAQAAERLIADVAPRFRERPGGYTRIIKLPPRRSDSSRRAMIEFVK